MGAPLLWDFNRIWRGLAGIAISSIPRMVFEMRTQLFAIAVGLTGLLIVVGAPRSFAGQDALTGAQIIQHFAGARIYGQTGLAEYQVDYRPNGEMVGATTNGGDRGRWWVRGNTLCRKWKRWLDGKEACFHIVINGNAAMWRVAGTKTILDTTSVPKR